MDSDLRNMVMAFRVTELQNLLGHFNKNKNGRKNELQARALELVKVNNSIIVAKIRELYRSIQLSLNQPLPASASAVLAHSHSQQFASSAMAPGRVYSSGVIQSAEKALYQNRYPTSYGQLPGLQVINHNHNSRVPICPDVQFRSLPFYDIAAQLTRPTSLLSTTSTGRAHEANFTFFLTPSQAGDIASSKEFNNTMNESKIQYTTQVQIRFCALETGSPQDDLFPPSMQLKVNNKAVPLPHPIPSNRPGVEPKRPSRPLNVTNFVKNSPTVTNNVNVTWASDNTSRDYVISITLVKKLVSQDLLNRLKSKGPRPSDYTKGMIKEMVRQNDADCILSSTFKVSVACPLGKCRMSLPCRASTCKHLQCFDANLYLQMNEKKPVWSCPVCDKFTAFEDLAIDGYFQEVITKLCNTGEDGNEIEVLHDGTWAPLKVKKEAEEPPAKVKKVKRVKEKSKNKTHKHKKDKRTIKLKPCKLEDTICLDDDDVAVISDEDSTRNKNCPAPTPIPVAKAKGPEEVIDLTFTSDEEEEEEAKDDEKGSSSSSSTSDDSDDEVIQPSRKRKKVSYVIQDSSSSSDDTPTSTSTTSKTTQPSTRPQPTGTPDCITLDSPTPSPEMPKNNDNAEKVEEKETTVVEKATTPPIPLSVTPPLPPTSSFSTENLLGSNSLSFNSMPLFGTSIPPPPGSDPGFQPNPFAPPYPSWDNSAVFPSDFSSLDYPSMDYFNQGSSSFGNSSSRPGNNSGGFGGGPRYF